MEVTQKKQPTEFFCQYTLSRKCRSLKSMLLVVASLFWQDPDGIQNSNCYQYNFLTNARDLQGHQVSFDLYPFEYLVISYEDVYSVSFVRLQNREHYLHLRVILSFPAHLLQSVNVNEKMQYYRRYHIQEKTKRIPVGGGSQERPTLCQIYDILIIPVKFSFVSSPSNT